jgi:hypothetical protein
MLINRQKDRQQCFVVLWKNMFKIVGLQFIETSFRVECLVVWSMLCGVC